MEKLSFKLEVFEGPLDALLYLITKNKLNIYDISISELLDQYMDYLNQLSNMDLEITSDFLEMASRLVYIKSSMLLPKLDEDDDADPRDELVATLIEYKTCKAMAEILKNRATDFDCIEREMQEIEHDMVYRRSHSPYDLLAALKTAEIKAKRRLPPPDTAFKTIVGKKIVSVGTKVVCVLKALIKGGKRPLRSFFVISCDRSEIVATFLAVLELVKSKKIVIETDENSRDIVCMNKTHKNKLRHNELKGDTDFGD